MPQLNPIRDKRMRKGIVSNGARPLKLSDKPLFEKYLALKKHYLCAYAFENIFLWAGFYKIFWKEIDKQLCVFFKDRIGCFLYLPPLGKTSSPKVIKFCFKIMGSFNKTPALSRIENVEEDDLGNYQQCGYLTKQSGCDYLLKRIELSGLKGGRFKHKRSAYNFFVKNYAFEYLSYSKKYQKECIDLYALWKKERQGRYSDDIYLCLLEDNFMVFKRALRYYSQLGMSCRLIKIKNKVRAVTLGYALNKDIFVVMFEICDLKFKGIAQYIFSEFCREQKGLEINIMDDSGLDNLRQVKMSYHPDRITNSYIAREYE